MPHSPRSIALPFLALAGVAGVAALISNGLASPSRHLAWRGSVAAQPSFTVQVERPASREPMPQGHAIEASRPPASDHPAPPIMRLGHTPPPAKPQEVVAAGPIREITGPEAWMAFQSGMPFLDARRSTEFTEGHIAGAWCTPVWESDLDERLISFKAARRPGPAPAPYTRAAATAWFFRASSIGPAPAHHSGAQGDSLANRQRAPAPCVASSGVRQR